LIALGLVAVAERAPSSAPAPTGHFTGPRQEATPAPGQGEGAKGGKGEKKRKPRFTISKETTYVTGPLDKDGYIDYVTALNERLSKGVTPENNANVLFWKAFGPHPKRATMPPEFFKWLGHRPPERGDYFIDLLPYIAKRFRVELTDSQREKIIDQLREAAQRPWTVSAYPHIASWLKANTHALALLVEGTRRSHYYSPVVPSQSTRDRPGLIGARIPGIGQCRQLGTVLVARAMLRLGEGRWDDAWDDLLACHRLGRLVARGSSYIEVLAGLAIDQTAGSANLVYLERARLTGHQLSDRLRDLQGLPAMPGLADHAHLGTRLTFLDAVMTVERGGFRAFERLRLADFAPRLPALVTERSWTDINWDPTLRDANRLYDRLGGALRLKDYRKRAKHLREFDWAVGDLKVNLVKLDYHVKANPGPTAITQIRDKMVGDFLIITFLPSLPRVQQECDRAEQVQRNLHVAFGLAAYHSEHGRYPRNLEALAPRYVPQIPQDLFTGKALIYRPAEKGYLLYSVGVNGEDEQGRTDDDDPPGDDLAVRMPLHPPRRE
jgi:hypothetical protein